MIGETQCMGHLPAHHSIGPDGWPAVYRQRCIRVLGVAVWQGNHGQILAACPPHRREVEALDAPYRTDLAERARHEMEDDQRQNDRADDWSDSTR